MPLSQNPDTDDLNPLLEATEISSHRPDECTTFEDLQGSTRSPESREPQPLPSFPGYRVTSVIAQGGMGCVYAARELALDREVAIKTLLDRSQAKRFLIESVITAQLAHPGIPPIYASGYQPDGSPFLVMKLVRGRTLADLLRERSSLQTDLAVYVQVFEKIAQAVGFAHSQGIIHRDIKPLNIMVGAFGEVQVMDWGLSKRIACQQLEYAAEQSYSEYDQHTLSGEIMGTPGYMSPEQARGEAVCQRTDVFALGSLLATMLTGQPAFVGNSPIATVEKAARSDLEDVQRRLRACGHDNELVELALHCLAPDQNERPRDAQAVAEAIAGYRISVEHRLQNAEKERAEANVREFERKKRRRLLCWAAGSISLVMIVGSATSIWQARRAVAAEAATALQLTETNQALTAAERRLMYVKKGREILGSIFTALDPNESYASVGEFYDVLRGKLIKTAGDLKSTDLGDPVTVMEIQDTLAKSLYALGDFENAFELWSAIHSSAIKTYGPAHKETYISANNLAGGYMLLGRFEEAIKLSEETLKSQRMTLGSDHFDTICTIQNLGMIYYQADKNRDAITLLEEALRRWEDRGPDTLQSLQTLGGLANAFEEEGETSRAKDLYLASVQRSANALGERHPHTTLCKDHLGTFYLKSGNTDEAVPLLEETYRLRIDTLGKHHPHTIDAIRNLAEAYLSLNRYTDAEQSFRELLECREQTQPEHWTTFNTRSVLGGILFHLKRYDEAKSLLLEGYQGMLAREDTIPDAGKVRILEAIDRLILVFSAANDAEETRKWQMEKTRREDMNSGQSH